MELVLRYADHVLREAPNSTNSNFIHLFCSVGRRNMEMFLASHAGHSQGNLVFYRTLYVIQTICKRYTRIDY